MIALKDLQNYKAGDFFIFALFKVAFRHSTMSTNYVVALQLIGIVHSLHTDNNQLNRFTLYMYILTKMHIYISHSVTRNIIQIHKITLHYI